jgi:hypothetical protein
MTPDGRPFKVPRPSKQPWSPEPFGMGDWVVIDADGLTGQVAGRDRSGLMVSATGPDGRSRNYYATGDPKTGRWERDGFRLVRSEEVQAATHAA